MRNGVTYLWRSLRPYEAHANRARLRLFEHQKAVEAWILSTGLLSLDICIDQLAIQL